jgi:hypothetical protein
MRRMSAGICQVGETNTVFSCLYFAGDSADQAQTAALLGAVLAEAGYAPFNPFGGSPARHHTHQARLFVCPRGGECVKVIGMLDADLLPAIAARAPFTLFTLAGDRAAAQVWSASGTAAMPLSMPDAPAQVTAAAPGDDIFSVLPDEVRRMNPDAGQANRMFARLSGTLLGKSGGAGQRDAAMAMLTGRDASAPDWDSAGGLALRATARAHGLPDPQQPDFALLRDAYALHERHRRRPNASSLPGDDVTMAAVPDALDYMPVYAGKG